MYGIYRIDIRFVIEFTRFKEEDQNYVTISNSTSHSISYFGLVYSGLSHICLGDDIYDLQLQVG